MMGFLWFSFFAMAFAPPSAMIFQRTAENSGSGIYSIEQEIQISNSSESFQWREQWLVENDRTLRGSLIPPKDPATGQALPWRWQALYSGGQKWLLNSAKKKENQKIPEEFTERWFHFRQAESLRQALIHLQIISPGAGAATKPKVIVRKNSKPEDLFKNEPESFVRLSRSQGVVNYAFGEASSEKDEALKPGLWIEQDQFVLRKIRFPSQSEIAADGFSPYSKGLVFPKVRIIKWGPYTATIRTLSVATRPNSAATQLQPQSLEASTGFDALSSQALKPAIEEFYTRFR